MPVSTTTEQCSPGSAIFPSFPRYVWVEYACMCISFNSENFTTPECVQCDPLLSKWILRERTITKLSCTIPLLSYPYDWQCWLYHLYYQQHLYTVNCSIASSHQRHRPVYAAVNASIKCAPHNMTSELRWLIKYQRILATVALHHYPQLQIMND